jgi:hypothetical protein
MDKLSMEQQITAAGAMGAMFGAIYITNQLTTPSMLVASSFFGGGCLMGTAFLRFGSIAKGGELADRNVKGQGILLGTALAGAFAFVTRHMEMLKLLGALEGCSPHAGWYALAGFGLGLLQQCDLFGSLLRKHKADPAVGPGRH